MTPITPIRVLTGPQKTRIRSQIAGGIADANPTLTARSAAVIATESMASLHGWDQGEKVVKRVLREMQKSVKASESRMIDYPDDWNEHAAELLRQKRKIRD